MLLKQEHECNILIFRHYNECTELTGRNYITVHIVYDGIVLELENELLRPNLITRLLPPLHDFTSAAVE
jgi:hypothetical protein